MVKWMEEIEVADSESDNHYHFMDNRVLPSHVDEALAKEEGKPSSQHLLFLVLQVILQTNRSLLGIPVSTSS